MGHCTALLNDHGRRAEPGLEIALRLGRVLIRTFPDGGPAALVHAVVRSL